MSPDQIKPLYVRHSSEEDRYVIAVPNPFKFHLRKSFRQAYLSIPEDQKVEFDFSQVTSLDSAAIGMLLVAFEHFGHNRDHVVLSNLHQQVRVILEMANLDRVFTILPS
ncbi:STAS domain-containing protein [Magnetococcus sp. PR-3]|uniref:STAS domain-containing protein n=1 Tax=Magnetococcus sp. PR-3 TaxID=3120355 RepID=UPI002FCDF36D